MLERLQATVGNSVTQRLAQTLPKRPAAPAADLESEAALLEGLIDARMPSQPVDSAGGLTTQTRAAAEPVTGPVEDVRVTTDHESVTQRGSANADAMTLHGQIFVDPAIDLASPYGTRVLSHELVHVSQQHRRRASGAAQFHNAEHDMKSPDLLADPGMVRAFSNNPAIRRGRKDDTVKLLQTRLLKFGYQMPRSINAGGELDGNFGGETLAAVKMFQRDHGLVDDGVVGHQTVTVLDSLGPAPSPSAAPLADPLAEGEETKKWSVQEYIDAWEKKEGRKMTEEERATLARGCIGITALSMQQGNINPPLNLSFDSFAQAKAVAAALNAILAAQPAAELLPAAIAANPALAALKNVQETFPVKPDPYEYKAIIFSKRFWSNQSANPAGRGSPDDAAFQPDPVTGQVDMTAYKYKARPGFVNFDYGWYDEETDSWWHANHAEPGMEVYQSTLEHYSRPLRDFDRQVFSVAFARRPK